MVLYLELLVVVLGPENDGASQETTDQDSGDRTSHADSVSRRARQRPRLKAMTAKLAVKSTFGRAALDMRPHGPKMFQADFIPTIMKHAT